jgi:hypothetical protein
MLGSSHRLFLLLLVLLAMQGCSTLGPTRDVDDVVPLDKTVVELPEDQLLDVWIELFDPGELPQDEDEAAGLSMDIRNAEARFIPEQLRATMEGTGYWGAVRLVPENTVGSELLVRGTIVESDGERLELEITAQDATGKQWLRRTYRDQIDYTHYLRLKRQGVDAFQSLYNTIANDLAKVRAELNSGETTAIRRVASLRFAEDLAPDAFRGYLTVDGSAHKLIRLPADSDTMYGRVRAIRERDFLLIDTLNGHYDNFTREMQHPYTEWRKARSEEAAKLRELEREAMQRKLLGVAAIVGAIALEAAAGNGNRNTSAVLRDTLVLGGAYAFKTGMDKSSETGIHRDAIVELDESFSVEAQPMVVEVEGETHKLTGSAEAQYAKWRALLKRIYESETGLTGS